MNGKDLLEKMSEASPELIAEAYRMPRRGKKLFVGIISSAAVAAAAVVLVGVSARKPPIVDTSSGASSDIDSPSAVLPSDETIPQDPPKLDFSEYKDLPIISAEDYSTAGFGMRSHTLGSPWTVDKGETIRTMPVYISSATDLDLEDMYEYMRRVAAAFGVSADELEITQTGYPVRGDETDVYQRKLMEEQGVPEEEIERELERIYRVRMQFTEVTGKADGFEFKLRPNYEMEVNFTTPRAFPQGHDFLEDAVELGYNDPRVIADGDGACSVYDGDGVLRQQIVNYWLNNTTFVEDWDEAGKLKRMVIRSTAGCEKIGDYPVLTVEQAEAILKSTRYDDAKRMPLYAEILEVDMVYDNNIGSVGLIPYYEFHVAAYESDEPYYVYTIPAVPEEFIDISTDDYTVSA